MYQRRLSLLPETKVSRGGTASSLIFWLIYIVISALLIAFVFLRLSPTLAHWARRDYGQSRSGNRTLYTYANLSTSSPYGSILRGEIIEEKGVPVAQFLGVKYAEAPRFRKPVPVETEWNGTRDALHWPPICLQKDVQRYEYLTRLYTYETREDCLYLNIWSPHRTVVLNSKRPSAHHPSTENLLPVIVFIHGGTFSYMGVSMEAYHGSLMAALGQVVYVTINYRLGLFGFFNHDHEASGKYHENVGLYDQIAALRWVRQHIRHFGGDPEQITLQGQSAGAISIGLLMTTPASSSLFRRAILQSGSPMMLKQIFASDHYDTVMQLANCTQEAKLETSTDDDDYEYEYESEENAARRRETEMTCLESLSTEQLFDIQAHLLADNPIVFGPTIPSKLLPEFPTEQLRLSGGVSQHEILLGANANESTLYLHQELPHDLPLIENINLTSSRLFEIINQLDNSSMQNFGPLILGEFRRRNITRDADIVHHFFILLSDFIFKGPVFKFAKLLTDTADSAKRRSTVYLYLFNEYVASYPSWIGAAHWNEMDFVFGIPLRYPERFTTAQQELSARLIRTWAHFARTGKPPPQLGLEWPALDSRNLHMTLQGSNASIGTALDMMFYNYYDLIYDSS